LAVVVAVVDAAANTDSGRVVRAHDTGRLKETKGVTLLDNTDAAANALDGFRSGKYGVLITTDADVSALWDMRGLVGTVINYDFPKHMGLYRNRASYVGHVGCKEAAVVSLFSPSKANVALSPEFVGMLKDQGHPVPDTLSQIAQMMAVRTKA
jgi:hypothetical protein